MVNDLFVVQIPIVEKILRTVLVYAVIVVLFRLTGKRGLAAVNTFDFVVDRTVTRPTMCTWACWSPAAGGVRWLV